ncbi:MAG: peptide deformylase [Bacteroidota bacterium]
MEKTVFSILLYFVLLLPVFSQTPFDQAEKDLILSAEKENPMRLFLITQKEDSILLREKAAEVKVDANDDLLQHFIRRLYKTVTDPNSMGVGIAAPQVGLSRRIIWVQRFDKEGFPFEVYLNPKIVQYTSLRQEGLEGCLSIPDLRDTVNRGYAILIEYDRLDGSHHFEMVEDFTAVIFQHEIDHLEGIVFTDHLQEEMSKAQAGKVLASERATASKTPRADERWQQRASYKMEIDMDVNKNQFSGTQNLAYTNNSPDTLDKVFYHLYFNAFQPGSMMDVRSRTIADPDGRVRDRIFHLNEDQIGYQKINKLSYRGEEIDFIVQGTILEVKLPSPIMPGETVSLDMEFEAQSPLQVRRTGRDNKEGIEYSMSQWYPKLCEYDYEGWHANPYVGREFYGIWGDFDVTITIPKNYVVAATGYLQNPNEMGHGYEAEGAEVPKVEGPTQSWRFIAPNVHDFLWAADPDYRHTRYQVPDGPMLHFFYQVDSTESNWKKLPEQTAQAFQILNKTFGKYPYKQYSVIQGGDGGMEYPMATLITGARSYNSLLGVTVHEAIHSWYQMVLGSNESLYPWMDEGFTSFATNYVLDKIKATNSLNPYAGSYMGYLGLIMSDKVEPMSTHSDHYSFNQAYSTSAYSRGAITLNQLSYIMGEESFYPAMLRYYNTWKFKHPNMTDFKRVMEKSSGLELDWYFEYWINSTHSIDYAVSSLSDKKKGSLVKLQKKGVMPMPLDVLVTYKDGKQELYNIPLVMMRGEKPKESWYEEIDQIVLPDWPWTNADYEFELRRPSKEISRIEIDPSYRMSDTNRRDNEYPQGSRKGANFFGRNLSREDLRK